ncbi:hypothetical protein TNCV_4487701 [Trichonephila clavipes]|nr:hypothetical protein TNCV_4487701 [Trichonephila clavipes]
MTHRTGLCPVVIANLPRELFENKSNGGELSCSNSGSDKDIRLSENDHEGTDKSADEIGNIPVNPNINVARDCTESIAQNSSVPGGLAIRNVSRLFSGPSIFKKHNANVSFFMI